MKEVYLNWRNSLKAKQKLRAYAHFDKPLDLDNNPDFMRVVNTIENITKHKFLPLTKYFKNEIRYRKNKDGKPKRSLKKRPIMYASHLDAHVYSYYNYRWLKKYDEFIESNNLSSCVIAYRRIIEEEPNGKASGKCNIHFAKEVFQNIQEIGTCTVIVTDISKFFDTLRHNILKKHLCMVLNVTQLPNDAYKIFRSLTDYHYVLNEKGSGITKLRSKIGKKLQSGKYNIARAVYECGQDRIKENRSNFGIPQGSPISGLLSNIYLAPFDCEMLQENPTVFYRRYSDDIALVCPPGTEKDSFIFLKENITKYWLSINPSKVFVSKFMQSKDGEVICTEVVNGEGKKLGRKYLDYLGFEFDGEQVFIRKGTLQRKHKKNFRREKKFHERQTDKNPRKQHTQKGKTGSGSYIKSASKVMKTVGPGVESQHKSMQKTLRRMKKKAKGALSKS